MKSSFINKIILKEIDNRVNLPVDEELSIAEENLELRTGILHTEILKISQAGRPQGRTIY